MWHCFCLWWGRVVLLKSVLQVISVYYLSFDRYNLSHWISIFKNKIIWGEGNFDCRKIHWVRWDQMFKSKSDRGLGITYLKALNLALLGTWRWHMLVKKESMWSKALVGIYGELQWTDRKWSWWWEKVWGVEKEQRRGCVNWFKESLEKVVRKGRNTRFWLDPWVNGGVIKEWFARCVV